SALRSTTTCRSTTSSLLIGIFDKATLALLTPCRGSPDQTEQKKDPNSHKAYESLHDLKSLAQENKIEHNAGLVLVSSPFFIGSRIRTRRT
ncbi:MAG: hypothetical protein EBV34_18505, partial [Betaproteobacteria bacterium]|nr:hypothetical protein [Betaproteobacteria bacterium]